MVSKRCHGSFQLDMDPEIRQVWWERIGGDEVFKQDETRLKRGSVQSGLFDLGAPFASREILGLAFDLFFEAKGISGGYDVVSVFCFDP